MKKSNFFQILHHFLLAIRQGLANIIFVILVILALIYSQYLLAIFKTERPRLPHSFTLRVASNDVIREESKMISLASLLRNGTTSSSVHELTQAIRLAANDPRVKDLWLDFDNLLISDFGVAEEIYAALLDFKTSAKPIYATAASYNKLTYMIAVLADQIWLDPLGDVDIQGFGSSQLFFAEAFEKVGIKANIFKVGRFKNAIEGYELTERSAANREMTTTLLSSLWDRFTQVIFEQRPALSVTQQQAILNPTIAQWFSSGSTASAAMDLGLIDHLGSKTTALKSIFKNVNFDAFGQPTDQSANFISYQDYINTYGTDNRGTLFFNNQPEIALVIASGTITQGYSRDSFMGSQTIIDNLAQVINHNTKALVLRIDTGGGDAYASEEIYRILMSIKQKHNIPIIISMGSTAASGGYWISLAGDEIIAHPTTITGSIGVFSAFMTAEEFARRWGIYEDTIFFPNQNNVQLSRFTTPNEAQATFYQQSVGFLYDQFLTRVVEAHRAEDTNAAHELAQGRVYTGTQALELKLIDHLGTLPLAIERAAVLAQIEEQEYVVNFYQEPVSPINQAIYSIMNNIHSSNDLLLEYIGLTQAMLINDTHQVYALETMRIH